MATMNRRKTTRRTMRKLPVEVSRVGFLSLFSKGPRTSAVAADVSEAGVRILSREPMTRWDEVFVHLTLGGEQSLRVKGRVAWCVLASKEKRIYSIGVEFPKASGRLKNALAAMLEAQQLDERLRKMRIHGRGGQSVN